MSDMKIAPVAMDAYHVPPQQVHVEVIKAAQQQQRNAVVLLDSTIDRMRGRALDLTA
jgi:hypothetical protein